MNKVAEKKVVLIGFSGHALVIAEALKLTGHEIIGYLEKNRAVSNELNLEYLGHESDNTVLKRIKGFCLFPAIGDNLIRSTVMSFFERKAFQFISVIHPDSSIAKQVNIGAGTFVARGACINPFVQIGQGVIINTGAIIEHECKISAYAHIAPGAVLAGGVSVGRNSFIGANAVIKQGVTIGDNVIIGAGAVVLKNIEENLTMVGNPARIIYR